MRIFLNLFTIVLLISTGPQATASNAPAGYYATAVGKTGEALRLALHEIIDDHTRFPYTSSATDCWDILNDADEDPNNSAHILDVYKNASYTKIAGGMGAYNREHVWPKSYGFPKDQSGNYPYTDCHHLMACDSSYNSARSNLPYDTRGSNDSEKATNTNNNQGGGASISSASSNWQSGSGATGHWETWIGKRGDVARALFYMDVRYEGGTHTLTGHAEPDLILTDDRTKIANSNTGSNEAIGYMGILSTLLKWHTDDPVDDLERERNNTIYSYQGNRNPFIDHPEWAFEIFFPTITVENTGSTTVRLRWNMSEITNLTLYASEALNASNTWSAITNTPQQDSQGWYVDLPAAQNAKRFFKLRL